MDQSGIEIASRPVAIKLTYALQNTPKALSVSSFEAPEVIPTNRARRARSNDVITWQLRANYALITRRLTNQTSLKALYNKIYIYFITYLRGFRGYTPL